MSETVRIISWFSCGAASAVATKLATEKYGSSVVPVYCDTLATEHPDNKRFMRDLERWIGREITVIRSKRYGTVNDVFERTKYMSGPRGARCTVEMKKIPRFEFQLPDDVHVFGYTVDEKKRAERFERDNFELRVEWPLIEPGLTKEDCKQILSDAGIELPMMYQLGYKNNNCLGCVKASSPAYWNNIRRDFPEVFTQRAEQSRKIGARLVILRGHRIFLDELPPDSREEIEEDLSCGPQCALVGG